MPKKQKKQLTLWLHPAQRTAFDDPHRFKVLVCSRRWGKLLNLDTPILTANRGWVTMKTIEVGDYVFHHSGKPIKVLAKSDVVSDERTFKLTFDDRTSIIAGENHLWVARNYLERNWGTAGRKKIELTLSDIPVRTTLELFETQKYGKRGDNNYSIDNHAVLDFPEKELLIDPYLLGIFLGDGCSTHGDIIGIDEEIFDEFSNQGWEVTKRHNSIARGVKGFITQLKKLNLIKNKHIPFDYLFSSYNQRVSLIQALIDTDGNIRESGMYEFTNTNYQIIEGLVFLLRSIGINPNIYEKNPLCSNTGKRGKKAWVVRFYSNNLCLARLPRKVERWEQGNWNKKIHAHRMIKSIEEIEPQPMQCLQVDSEDGLWLAGEQLITTHNSRLILTRAVTRAVNYKGAFDPASPPVVGLIYPSLKQGRSVIWNPLMSVLDNHPAVEKIYKSDFRISFKGRRPDIILRGCNEDSGDSLRGLKFLDAIFDEVQDVKKDVIELVVAPALADTEGSTALYCGCVHPNTRVLTDTGFRKIKTLDPGTNNQEWKPIDQQLWSIEKNWDKADGFWNNGIADTKKITTYHGFQLEATHQHPVWTKSGWKKMEELVPGDEIAIDFGMDVWGNLDPLSNFNHPDYPVTDAELTPDLSYQIGYLLHRGIFRNNKYGKFVLDFYLRHKDQRNRKYWLQNPILQHNFFEVDAKEVISKPIRSASKLVFSLLRHLELNFTVPVFQRKFPDWIFNTSRENAIEFLKGIVDSQGTILKLHSTKSVNQPQLKITTRSEDYAQGIQLLLLNLGIISRIVREPNHGNISQEAAPYIYKLVIRGLDFVKFRTMIGFKNSPDKQVIDNWHKKLYKSSFKVQADYLWDKIEDISDSKSLTMDFTIPKTQSYLGNGIVVHNTPKGRATYFYELFNREKSNPDWKSFHYTIYDNPFIKPVEIENFKRIYPPKVFEQEFLAGWVSFEGQIFSELKPEHIIPDDQIPNDFEEVLTGIDWGDCNPATVILGYKAGTYYVIDYWENPNPGRAIEQHVHNQETLNLIDKHCVSKGFADPSRPGFIMSMRRAGVPRLVKAYNRVNEGNSVVNTLLYQKRILIAKSCERVYETMTSYHRKKKDGILYDEPAPNQDDHLCFTAGTEVMTLDGWVKVQDLKLGDWVWTRKQWQPVIATGHRDADTIMMLRVGTDEYVRCTPDHPFIQTRTERERHYNPIMAQDITTETSIVNLNQKFSSKPRIMAVPGSNEIHTVYNISVANAPEYFVKIGDNGFLVHNCDALRYVVSREVKRIDQEMFNRGFPTSVPTSSSEICTPPKNSLF